MKNEITHAKIWLPYDEKSIKVQQMNIRNMKSKIGSVSANLGAKVESTSFVMPGSEGRFELISPSKINRHYNPHISSFYGRSQCYTPATYMRYRYEHPIIRILIESYYNKRISYYELWRFLKENKDFDWTTLAPYYEAIKLLDFKIQSIDEIRESISRNIEETAHGYNPIGGSIIIREHREDAIKYGEWNPSYYEIQQEAETNEQVLKRVFKKNI